MIKLLLVRTELSRVSTIGKLFDITNADKDHIFLCYTLEDPVREVENQEVKEWKIYGETAIPRGIYNLAYTYSNRFMKYTIQLMNVPGFSGIRIHAGNKSNDTEGCILVGKEYMKDTVLKSKIAVNELENYLLKIKGWGTTPEQSSATIEIA